MKHFLTLALLTLLAPAALAAQPVRTGYVNFDLPDGWMRDDEAAFASFTSPDGGLTISILTQLSGDDAEDDLEDFIARAEADETVVERGEPEELSDDPFDVWRQETTTSADGRTFRRLYTAAAPDDVATMIIAAGEVSAWAANGADARALLASLRLTGPAAVEKGAPALDDHPGEGGLDGVFLAAAKRDALNAGTFAWTVTERGELLYFDPLGDIYRGPALRFDLSVFDRCDGGQAWRCGRYRIEGGEIAFRWRDGTAERRAFTLDGTGLRLGRSIYHQADLTGVPAPSGAYAMQDVFNQGLSSEPSAPVIRFLEGGKFVLEGFDSFRSPAFGPRRTAGGKFLIKGRVATLVYANGATEVLGFARLPAADGDRVMLGGRLFARP